MWERELGNLPILASPTMMIHNEMMYGVETWSKSNFATWYLLTVLFWEWMWWMCWCDGPMRWSAVVILSSLLVVSCGVVLVWSSRAQLTLVRHNSNRRVATTSLDSLHVWHVCNTCIIAFIAFIAVNVFTETVNRSQDSTLMTYIWLKASVCFAPTLLWFEVNAH